MYQPCYAIPNANKSFTISGDSGLTRLASSCAACMQDSAGMSQTVQENHMVWQKDWTQQATPQIEQKQKLC